MDDQTRQKITGFAAIRGIHTYISKVHKKYSLWHFHKQFALIPHTQLLASALLISVWSGPPSVSSNKRFPSFCSTRSNGWCDNRHTWRDPNPAGSGGGGGGDGDKPNGRGSPSRMDVLMEWVQHLAVSDHKSEAFWRFVRERRSLWIPIKATSRQRKKTKLKFRVVNENDVVLLLSMRGKKVNKVWEINIVLGGRRIFFSFFE